MRLFLLILITLIAFAANSVLNRMALALGEAGPGAFLALRLVSGAVMLALILALRGQLANLRPSLKLWPAAMLFLYMVGFSFAYVSLDTGTGALILFGGVQMTMFAATLWQGERPGLFRWVGAALGLVGLVILFWPGISAPSPIGAALMAASAVGWGMYSIYGRSVADPLGATAGAFIMAAPFGVLMLLALPAQPMSLTGAGLAILSGAVTSAMGYAMWYAILPRIDASLAAIAQLTVPLIALVGGMLFLGEPMTWRFFWAACLILGGVLIALQRKSN